LLAEDLPPLKKLGMLARHKSVGITILALRSSGSPGAG